MIPKNPDTEVKKAWLRHAAFPTKDGLKGAAKRVAGSTPARSSASVCKRTRTALPETPGTPSIHTMNLPASSKANADLDAKHDSDPPRKRPNRNLIDMKLHASVSQGTPSVHSIAPRTKKSKAAMPVPSVATQDMLADDADMHIDQHPDCDFRPDTAPYPRHLKPLDEVTLAKPQGPQVWVCPLPKCGHEIRIPAGPCARIKLQVAKSSHLKHRHTDGERASVPRLGFQTEITTPSHDLPDSCRAWTCGECGKGLPTLPKV